MFDRQLTMDGREEDIAPVHEQPRMFEFPKTSRGQLNMPDVSLNYNDSPRPITQAEAEAIAEGEYGWRHSCDGWIIWCRGSDGGTHFADTAYSEGSARGAAEERRRGLARRIMAGQCQHTVFYDRARDRFYCA